MGVRAAIPTVIPIEDALLRGPAPDIVGVTPFAVVDRISCRRFGVLDQSSQQRDSLFALAHKDMPKLMRDRQRAERTHRVDEQ